MPRKPRQFQIGGIYHIVNRGVEKRSLFLKNQDYSRFILALEFFNNRNPVDLWTLIERFSPKLLEKRLEAQRGMPKKRIAELLLFALMPNHYHLVFREIVPNGVSLFMQKLGGYTTYFNKQYDRVGPLFQSRYKSVEIKNDVQLHAVFAYVHTNPVGLIEPGWKEFRVADKKRASEYLTTYRWSSYRDYIGLPTFPTATQREFFLEFFGDTQKSGQAVEDWINWKASQAGRGPEAIE